MENRKPFNLRYILILYNFIQVIFSAWLFYEVSVAFRYRHQFIFFPLPIRILLLFPPPPPPLVNLLFLSDDFERCSSRFSHTMFTNRFFITFWNCKSNSYDSSIIRSQHFHTERQTHIDFFSLLLFALFHFFFVIIIIIIVVIVASRFDIKTVFSKRYTHDFKLEILPHNVCQRCVCVFIKYFKVKCVMIQCLIANRCIIDIWIPYADAVSAKNRKSTIAIVFFPLSF